MRAGLSKGVVDVNLGKTLRTGVIGALVAAVPVSSSYAATRPNAAVPAAASSAATAQGAFEDGTIAWIPIAIIAATVLVAIWIAADDDDNDVEFSQG